MASDENGLPPPAPPLAEQHATSAVTVAAPVPKATSGFAETRDFRIAMLGNVDAGKSTLVGCLTRGMLDDGRGRARAYVLKHQHELKRGQTSSVSLALLGYKPDGEQVMPATATPEAARKSHNRDFYEVASRAAHRVTLVDLCGHEKYLKSSIYGLTALNPHCAMVVIGAERGIQRMTREHVGLCCALRIPFFVVVTKVDMVPENVMRETQMKVRRILKRAGRKGFYVRADADVDGAVKCMETNQVAFAPVFEVSAVTGTAMDFLRAFVKSLAVQKARSAPGAPGIGAAAASAGDAAAAFAAAPATAVSTVDAVSADAAKNGHDEEAAPPSASTHLQFLLDDVFNVPGVGIVIGGTVLRGQVHVGQRVHAGPDRSGNFRFVQVRSIHRQCVPSSAAYEGQHATLSVKPVGRGTLKREHFRKGMAVVGEPDIADARLCTVWEFEADVKVLHHSTTIDVGYSPFIHLAGVRQSARIERICDDEGNTVVARTGSQVRVRFRFLHCAEHLELGRPLIFREGNAKGCGRVTTLFDEQGNQVAPMPLT